MIVRARLRLSLLLLITPLVVCSCVSIQDASPNQSARASGPPRPGTTKVFVYRPGRLLAGALVHRVFIDGRLLGSNASGTFLVAEVNPGHHVVTAGYDQHDLDAQAGRTYYYNQTVWMAMYDPSTATGLEQVSEAVGRQGVSKCKQAATNF